jgi:hypothetical protein
MKRWFYHCCESILCLKENLTAAAKQPGWNFKGYLLFDNLRPDIVVTVADRFETMATAIAAI